MPLLDLVPKVRSENIVVQDLEKEVLIYDLKADKAFCLNETSKIVWQACDGKKNIVEIVEFVSANLNSPPNQDLVWFALNQLRKEKLLENGDELPNHFGGLSRREVIKKVGLGTVIALPIISSIVAPTIAQAASGCLLTCTTITSGVRQSCSCATTPSGQRDRGCTCTAASECCPGLACSPINGDGLTGMVCNNGTTSNI